MADPWDKKPRGGGNPLDQAAQNIQAIRSYVKQMRTLAEDFDTEYDTQVRARSSAGENGTPTFVVFSFFVPFLFFFLFAPPLVASAG